MIEFKNLTKKYGDLTALNNLNLKINNGEIFGLIGHNGAGKSTTIKLLVSILEPTEGQIIIDGLNLSEHRQECKRKIGYVPDSPDMFLNLSAYEYWSLIAEIFGLTDNQKNERLEYFGNIFNMLEHKDETISSFSHGMRQKTFVIGTLIAQPSIWVLDEPLTGLDPQAAFDLKKIMKEHVKSGNSVLFSTHILEIAEHLCNRIGILNKGQLIFVGTIEELKSQYKDDTLENIYLSIIKE